MIRCEKFNKYPTFQQIMNGLYMCRSISKRLDKQSFHFNRFDDCFAKAFKKSLKRFEKLQKNYCLN